MLRPGDDQPRPDRRIRVVALIPTRKFSPDGFPTGLFNTWRGTHATIGLQLVEEELRLGSPQIDHEVRIHLLAKDRVMYVVVCGTPAASATHVGLAHALPCLKLGQAEDFLALPRNAHAFEVEIVLLASPIKVESTRPALHVDVEFADPAPLLVCDACSSVIYQQSRFQWPSLLQTGQGLLGLSEFAPLPSLLCCFLLSWSLPLDLYF